MSNTSANSVSESGSEFVDRRATAEPTFVERRQFTNSHDELTPEVRELAQAIDQYKLQHRRRFISYDEMFSVMQQLGYHK